MENRRKPFSDQWYNELVHDFASVFSALNLCSLDTPFCSETTAFLTEWSTRISHEYGFDFCKFWSDVRNCIDFPATYYRANVIALSDVDSSSTILSELVRAFKNRAPSLGEQFERVVKQNKRVAEAAVEFLHMEYLYLDGGACYQDRELENETFRVAMFETGNDRLYTAAFNVIRSYAASMARTKLAADVEAAIGGETNAD